MNNVTPTTPNAVIRRLKKKKSVEGDADQEILPMPLIGLASDKFLGL
jgi:hypothetical protein